MSAISVNANKDIPGFALGMFWYRLGSFLAFWVWVALWEVPKYLLPDSRRWVWVEWVRFGIFTIILGMFVLGGTELWVFGNPTVLAWTAGLYFGTAGVLCILAQLVGMLWGAQERREKNQ